MEKQSKYGLLGLSIIIVIIITISLAGGHADKTGDYVPIIVVLVVVFGGAIVSAIIYKLLRVASVKKIENSPYAVEGIATIVSYRIFSQNVFNGRTKSIVLRMVCRLNNKKSIGFYHFKSDELAQIETISYYDGNYIRYEAVPESVATFFASGDRVRVKYIHGKEKKCIILNKEG